MQAPLRADTDTETDTNTASDRTSPLDGLAPSTAAPSAPRFQSYEVVILWFALFAWLAVFVGGTLIDSSPYRARFAGLNGGFFGILGDGFIVVTTYTLTNVGLLCLLASTLGALGARTGLGADGDTPRDQDSSAPASSAVLRGFFVFTAVLAGVIVFADHPVDPTQTQYVRLAGLTSLLAFTINYHPAYFANLLMKAGMLVGRG